MIRARAAFEDSQTLRLEPVDGKPLDDDRLAFEHCILATGSSPTRIPAFDLPTHRGDGLDRRAGTARRARVAPGRRRRLHRPGDGHGLRGAWAAACRSSK